MMNVVLGVSGSISAYRAADLARDLMRTGCTVRVCLTDAAQHFVTPLLFETLTGQPCLVDVFDEPVSGRMAHIDWARQADVILIAPATATTIARLAHGIGDDMLTTLVLASTAPLILAPAMNPQMYASDSVRENLTRLRSRATAIIEPTEGDVACGEHGQGKLAPSSTIVQAVLSVLNRSLALKGQCVLITAGPTREPIDSVRFLSNRSSGKMGAALARAALLMGAEEVIVVSGPTMVAYPQQAKVFRVQTADEMLRVALENSREMDWIIGSAAVADYRPAHPAQGKIRRSAETLSLELVPNPDIIATLAARQPRAKCVGFAAEPSSDITVASEKLIRKGLFAVAMNDVSQNEIGFDSEDNRLTLLRPNQVPLTSETASKLACALWLLGQLTSPGS